MDARTASAAEVDVAILHPDPDPDSGRLTLATAAGRAINAERHASAFRSAGAREVRIVAGRPDDRPFGAKLRELVEGIGPGGLVVLGSGAIPLATRADHRVLVDAASAQRPRALTNNRYSADVIAVACAGSVLAAVPDLPNDNALPRWLAEVAGVPVADRRGRWRLGVDIDGPLDLVLLGGRWRARLAAADTVRAEQALAGVRATVADSRGELVVTGRVSAANLAWLEAHTASRTRAIVEERGLRTRIDGQRPAASVLGALLERDGPASLGEHLTRLGDAAVVDTRVLLAHRFGADEAAWPRAEDRFASDLLLPDRIGDLWLRTLTVAAATATIPVVLGGHTLVGPGLRLALGRRR
jgi:hypothetical protein